MYVVERIYRCHVGEKVINLHTVKYSGEKFNHFAFMVFNTKFYFLYDMTIKFIKFETHPNPYFLNLYFVINIFNKDRR